MDQTSRLLLKSLVRDYELKKKKMYVEIEAAYDLIKYYDSKIQEYEWMLKELDK